jgi:DNA-binding MarR family transcriptional regulator
MTEAMETLIAELSSLVEKTEDDTLEMLHFGDLTHQQIHYLKTIAKLHNPTLSELAKSLRLTKPSVTVLVDKLVSKGYVRKVQSDADRRSLHLHLAEKGLALNRAHRYAHERFVAHIRSKLTSTESAILMELLKKLI